MHSKRSLTRRMWAAQRSFSYSGRAKKGKRQKGGRRGMGEGSKVPFARPECEKLLCMAHVHLIWERLLRRLETLHKTMQAILPEGM